MRLVMLPPRWARMSPLSPGASTTAHRGGAIWIELKAPGVKPEEYQVREHKRMRAMGQRVEVIDSIAGVDELLS